MTFKRFKSLWHRYVTPKAHPANPSFIDEGTPRVNAELVKVARGEPSELDDIARRLRKRDALIEKHIRKPSAEDRERAARYLKD